MFFSITTGPDSRFPNQYECGGLWVNLDNGWSHKGTVWTKGYADNSCTITANTNTVKVEHSNPRSFPMWSAQGIITNLSGTDLTAQDRKSTRLNSSH